jgi:hypothetical protein
MITTEGRVDLIIELVNSVSFCALPGKQYALQQLHYGVTGAQSHCAMT